jgi:hypothetical protein
MIYKKAGFLTFFLIAVLVSCKDDETLEPDKVDDCLTTSSVKRGDIIPGEYIVSFPAGPANGRVLNVTSILERHNIAREKISDVIQGEAAHYIVNLSIEQATALSSESSILRLEPEGDFHLRVLHRT